MITIIIFAVLIIIMNVTQDEIRFHWSRFFGNVIKLNSSLYKWFNPIVSWENKNRFKSKFLRFLFSTVLVWTTDFWHLLKAIIINSAFVIFLILIKEPFIWWKWIVILIVLNAIWGILFELFIGFYGALGDWTKKK